MTTAIRLTYTTIMIDLEELAVGIRKMDRTHALYRVLRDELKKRGWWRYHSRGDPAKGYRMKGSKS